MPIIFFLIFIIPKILISDVLNLICTNNYIDVKSLDVKDLFVIIDKDSNKIELGGLSFIVDAFYITATSTAATDFGHNFFLLLLWLEL